MSNNSPIPQEPLHPAQLEEAFSLFNQVSAQLTGSYQQLQQQVERLTNELETTNKALKYQLLEKETLSNRLSLLIAALPSAVVVIDKENHIIEYNREAENLFGKQLFTNQWDDIFSHIFIATDSPDEWEVKKEYQTPERLRFNVKSSAFDSEGGCIILLQNMTQTFLMQRQLALHQRLSAMGEMSAALAHQLRTPLATALLYTAHLAKEKLSELDRQRFAQKSLQRLRHLERLVQDMLLFVRGESAQEQDWHLLSLRDLVIEAKQTIEPQMQQAHIHFFCMIETLQPDILINGDHKNILSALLNLLENALYATPKEGMISINVSPAPHAPFVHLYIQDSGCGMPPNVLERAFEPFMTTRADGTGLGLAIARSIIRAHHGDIFVDSIPEKGTTVIVRLPYVQSEQSDK